MSDRHPDAVERAFTQSAGAFGGPASDATADGYQSRWEGSVLAIHVGEESQERARDGVRAELAAALTRDLSGEVLDDPYSRHLFASDASMYARDPLLVACPRDADDV